MVTVGQTQLQGHLLTLKAMQMLFQKTQLNGEIQTQTVLATTPLVTMRMTALENTEPPL
jgi:hypothetical protein